MYNSSARYLDDHSSTILKQQNINNSDIKRKVHKHGTPPYGFAHNRLNGGIAETVFNTAKGNNNEV